ncbi:MAG: ABC transporter ATP-binding protein [Actinobacteria bacterium]|nr:MAG: ABC transporter ATP-binding protein [Actinomycetota bacterium]
MSAVLEAVDVSKRFGGVHALRNVSLRLREGDVVGLIGPNGSGKTTFLNCLSGVFPPSTGRIALDGRPIPRRGHAVARRGVVRTFQNIRLFGWLTALQNVEVGALGAGRARRGSSRRHALQTLAQLGIDRLADRYAGTLSYGDQRRLEIARALAAAPRFLLLDEPAAGMNEGESAELGAAVQAIRRERGCGVLVVEHDLRLIMRICDHVVVLNEGEVIASGSPGDVRTDPAVVAAYIGTDDTGNATNGGAE